MPDYVVNVDSVEVFKKRLDKFWSNQPVKFDWRARLTGTGDRSEFLVEESEYCYLSIDIGDADLEAL